MMREAHFYAVFCGIETPELAALDAMQKSHNSVMPILDAVATINSYGIEVVSGIILGLDTDTPATGANLIDFIDASGIPVLTINLLQALPKTPLWDRLAASGRLAQEGEGESNVVFARPYDEVLADWHDAIRHAYTPEAIYRRFTWNARHTYPNRIRPPLTRARLNARNLRRALVILSKILVKIGLYGDYRRSFWGFALPLLRAGMVGELIAVALVAHHMIRFARECTEGRQNASFYADRAKPAADQRAAAA
jgi:radical SAM superfamily enzyme YgiQ (UPF0313 family)